jgi:hypothetical protein
MTTPPVNKLTRHSLKPLLAWVIMLSSFCVFFSREAAFIGALAGTTVWIFTCITKKHLSLLIPFIICLGLSFLIRLPFVNTYPPVINLGIVTMFWGLTFSFLALCLYYLFKNNN